MKKILLPIPHYGCDPTEVAIPYQILIENNFEVVFATPNGKKAKADRLMLEGKRLGIFKKALAARKDAVAAYHKMTKSKAFCSPIAYADIVESDFDALFLPGGHDKGVKVYLESALLQAAVVDFFASNKPVGAVCHGVVLLARSIDPKTNKSVIYDYKTTALLHSQERLAYNMTRLWLKDYYLTYGNKTVQQEVEGVLSNKNNFKEGRSPLFRDSPQKLNRGFVVRDRNYLSARWPGDIYLFSSQLVDMLKELG